MWYVNGDNLQMAEGDYGVGLQVLIKGTEFGENDSVKFTFKKKINTEAILEKVYQNITDNMIELKFTQADSAKFSVGNYVYSMDWYQNGNFMCNIVLASVFKVVDKA